MVTDPSGARPLAYPSYAYGYGPSDLADAYDYPAPTVGAPWTGNGQTVAIVDAFDDPGAEADLSAYRAQFGLSPCTTANGCFTKVDQRGGTAYPAADAGWAKEISLDLDAVSAVCAQCRILLVEADSASFTNLVKAVDRAVTLGATVVSNSYGAPEFSGETTLESHYDHPGVPMTVSSGDGGYGTLFPAASQYVTAVGGTSLVRSTSARGWSETAWKGSGSGCSAYVKKPTWQSDSCRRRMVADVSAVADPNTGLAVYHSYGSTGGNNWYVVGGTSASAPIVASLYALAGNGASVSYGSYPYAHTGSLWDVTSGSNGRCRRRPYRCTAMVGYDGPTGLGTPRGTGAF